MADKVAFDELSARRISAAVRWVEEFQKRSPPGASPQPTAVPFELRRFEMTAQLLIPEFNEYPSAVEVYRLRWDHSLRNHTSDVWGNGTSDTFEVYDYSRHFCKSATPDGERGAYGIAFKPHDVEHWEILEMEEQAGIIKFKTLGALLVTDDYVSAECTDYWNGYPPTWPLTTPITVWNTDASSDLIYEADAGDYGYASYDGHADKYWIIGTECL